MLTLMPSLNIWKAPSVTSVWLSINPRLEARRRVRRELLQLQKHPRKAALSQLDQLSQNSRHRFWPSSENSSGMITVQSSVTSTLPPFVLLSPTKRSRDLP